MTESASTPPVSTPGAPHAAAEGRSAGRDGKRRMPPLFYYPEYAIAQKLITREEYDGLRNQYYAQSQVGFGIALSLAVLAFVLWTAEPKVGYGIGAYVVVLMVVAFLAGVDRQHKYYSELQLLIYGRYRAALKAAADAAEAAKKKEEESKRQPTVQATLAELTTKVAALQDLVEKRLTAPVNITNQFRERDG
jgi:hypothetical protein